jgi:hypothetical protein
MFCFPCLANYEYDLQARAQANLGGHLFWHLFWHLHANLYLSNIYTLIGWPGFSCGDDSRLVRIRTLNRFLGLSENLSGLVTMTLPYAWTLLLF